MRCALICLASLPHTLPAAAAASSPYAATWRAARSRTSSPPSSWSPPASWASRQAGGGGSGCAPALSAATAGCWLAPLPRRRHVCLGTSPTPPPHTHCATIPSLPPTSPPSPPPHHHALQFTPEERGVKDVAAFKGVLTYGGRKDGVDCAVGNTDLTGKVGWGAGWVAGRGEARGEGGGAGDGIGS